MAPQRGGGPMRKTWFMIFGCVLMILSASTFAAASVNFGTGYIHIYDDDDVAAVCPSISDWDYSKIAEGPTIDVEVTCEVRDSTAGNVDFDFTFLFTLEIWQVSPPMCLGLYDDDEWSLSSQQTVNYPNVQPWTSDTLSIQIDWLPNPNQYYKCTFSCEVEVEYDSASDLETWSITCIA
ncbi:MAG: hypothetical protein GWN89_14185 [Thermoplasmata archaeon]|nr:hypothetical protein [Thermoplasmata archaeon]